MGKNGKDHLIPSYVIHALIAGVLFLIVALVLGVLMFRDNALPEAPQPDDTQESELPEP